MKHKHPTLTEQDAPLWYRTGENYHDSKSVMLIACGTGFVIGAAVTGFNYKPEQEPLLHTTSHTEVIDEFNANGFDAIQCSMLSGAIGTITAFAAFAIVSNVLDQGNRKMQAWRTTHRCNKKQPR